MTLLTATGGLLRLYRLDEQSVWLDEFLSVANLRSDAPGQMLDFLQLYFPEHAASPVFYVILYYWSHIAGDSLVVLRALPVAIGTLTIPLLYCILSRLLGRGIGVFVALCYALSPQHIWHAQELRQYCLSVPLATLAIYALLKAVETRRARWWTVNLLLNMSLVWTHTLNAFALPPQGIFVLWVFRKDISIGFKWTIAHFTMLVPVVYLILNGPYRYRLPGGPQLAEMCSLILLDDIVAYNEDLIPPYKTNAHLVLTSMARSLLPLQPLLDLVFALIIVVAVAYGLIVIIAERVNYIKSKEKARSVDARLNASLLFLVFLFIPDVTLVTIGWYFGLQLAGSMYALYSTIGLYTVMGIAINTANKNVVKIASVASICVLLVFQLLLLLPEKSRSDWLGVAGHLNEFASVGDAVIDIQFFGPASYLPYNGLNPSLATNRVWTLEAAVDQAVSHLSELEGDAKPEESEIAWIAYERHLLEMRWPTGPQDMLDALNARNLSGRRVLFPGHYNAELIRVERVPNEVPRRLMVPVPPIDEHIDYNALLVELGLNDGSEGERSIYLETLRKHVPMWPPVTPFFVYFQAMWVLADGNPVVANALLEWTIKGEPRFGLAHFGLGLLQASLHRGEALSSFDDAFRLHRGVEDLFGSYVQSLLYGEDCDDCLLEVDRLESKGYVAFADALRSTCRMRHDVDLIASP